MNNIILKNELFYLRSKEYSLPESFNYEDLIGEMLVNIGSTDSELRDDLIYMTLSHLILEDFLSNDELQSMLKTILDNRHLFHNIGESNTDSVFTRSFSMLVIPLILMANQKNNFLNYEDILEIKDKLIWYLQHEKDWRGFVPGKGWAHALAHTADAINELAKYNLPIEVQLEILGAIKGVICIKETVYTNLEDERLITAVITILKKGSIDIKVVENWVTDFTHWKKTELWHEEYKIITNVKNFLGSLYFRLEQEIDQQIVAEIVKEKLTEMMNIYT